MIQERSAISLPPFMNSRSYAMPVHAWAADGSALSTVNRNGFFSPVTSSGTEVTVSLPARSRASISM